MEQAFGGAQSVVTNPDGLLSRPRARPELFFHVEAKARRAEGIGERAGGPNDAAGAADDQDGVAIVRRG